jgi:hypothetical protein
MALGALFGVGTGMAILTGVDVPGVGSWLVAVAVAKLGFISAFALSQQERYSSVARPVPTRSR